MLNHQFAGNTLAVGFEKYFSVTLVCVGVKSRNFECMMHFYFLLNHQSGKSCVSNHVTSRVFNGNAFTLFLEV